MLKSQSVPLDRREPEHTRGSPNQGIALREVLQKSSERLSDGQKEEVASLLADTNMYSRCLIVIWALPVGNSRDVRKLWAVSATALVNRYAAEMGCGQPPPGEEGGAKKKSGGPLRQIVRTGFVCLC